VTTLITAAKETSCNVHVEKKSYEGGSLTRFTNEKKNGGSSGYKKIRFPESRKQASKTIFLITCSYTGQSI